MNRNLLLFAGLVLAINSLLAQNQTLSGKGKVIECKEPYQKIKLDMLETQDNFITEFNLSTDTKITNKKGEVQKPEALLPGNEVQIEAVKLNYKWTLNSCVISSTRLGSEVKVNGKLERYYAENDYAVIDGNKVKLESNTKIVGDKELKGQSFKSFREISAGNFVKAEGVRKPDGLVYASKVSLTPDNFGARDAKLRQSMNADFSSSLVKEKAVSSELRKYSDSIATGIIKFGDLNYQITENATVQSYVNAVGNKIVPTYQKEIPGDVPEKLNFKFVVVDNPVYNVFSMPNGLVVVNSGLLQMLDNEAQLASVLGHEIAHCTHKHATERYEKQQKQQEIESKSKEVKDLALPILSTFLQGNSTLESATNELNKVKEQLSKLPPQTQKAFGNILNSVKGIGDNNFDKDNEEQADRIGLYYMQEAGYDPREAVSVWQKFMELTSNGKVMEELKSTTNTWVVSKDRYNYANPLGSIGDVLGAKLINILLDNNFSDHPKARTRFRSVNQLVAENYSDSGSKKAVVNAEEYAQIKSLLASAKK